MWVVYILIKQNEPVYIGCTSCIIRRVKQHRSTKDFDKYFILKRFKNKRDALACENGIISFLSLFPQEQILNTPITLLDYHSKFHLS